MRGTFLGEVLEQVIMATNERLSPLGFSRRRTVLRIMSQDTCGIIGFQRSVKSSDEKLLFTVNCGIVCGDLLESGLSGLPNAKIIDAHVRLRIGMLLPGCPDKWWEITASTDPDALAKEVAELILEMAVPYIQRYLSADSTIALWESGQSPGLTDGQRVNALATLKAKRRGGST